MGIPANLVPVLTIPVCGGYHFLGRKVCINVLGILWGYICKKKKYIYVSGCWTYLETLYLDNLFA